MINANAIIIYLIFCFLFLNTTIYYLLNEITVFSNNYKPLLLFLILYFITPILYVPFVKT